MQNPELRQPVTVYYDSKSLPSVAVVAGLVLYCGSDMKISMLMQELLRQPLLLGHVLQFIAFLSSPASEQDISQLHSAFREIHNSSKITVVAMVGPSATKAFDHQLETHEIDDIVAFLQGLPGFQNFTEQLRSNRHKGVRKQRA